MTSRGRSFTHTSEWDSHDDYNDSLYETQYPDDSASVTTNLDHCRLYITNIPRGLNDEGLQTAFSKFGTLVEVYLSKDPSKKYGLLSYETPGEAKLAMMKMNKTEPLKLNINIAHKSGKKEDRPRKDWQNRSNNNIGRDRNSNKDETGSIDSKGRGSRAQDTAITDTMTNGDNNMDDLLEDEYGFSDILDPKLTLELETLKMEQLKVKEEQLQCKTRMIMLKRQEKRPLSHSTPSNRCILPDGKIVVRNVGDRGAADLDVNHSAGAGDSRLPALLQVRSRACVSCGDSADSFCARCGVTPYCSTICQAKDWAGRHRAVCHNLARLSGEVKGSTPEPELKIENPAPLRRPYAVSEVNRERSQKRDDDIDTKVSDRSDRTRRFQDKRDSGMNRGRNTNNPPRNFHSNGAVYRSPRILQTPPEAPVEKMETSEVNTKPVVKVNMEDASKLADKPQNKPLPKDTSAPEPAPVLKTEPKIPPPQVNGAKQDTPTVKPATVGDVTPTRKLVPKNYLIEQLSIGDTVLLSVDSKAADCRSTFGDYVCLSMHENFELKYQSLLEDYVLVCDADQQEFKLIPGEACSYFNIEDGGWYRARCLNPTTIALIDSSRILTVAPTDKIRKLPAQYEQVPEFCCVLECKNVEVGANLKCVLVSKAGDGYKVSLENVDTGSAIGNGVVARWMPTVEYPPVQPVIPEVPRPPLRNNSSVLLVDATALDRAFVRPSDTRQQSEYDQVVQNALLAGRRATPLKKPPLKGQTVIAKFIDGVHYRALCKRTQVAQNKYLLEYIDYGNIEICRNLEDLFPCPPELDLAACPTQVSMIKLSSEGGEFTPPAAAYIEKLKDSNEELILRLQSADATASSGSEALLRVAKNSEMVNKKIIEMCTPDWKKFLENGGDVVQVAPLRYNEVEYQAIPPGPVELDILDFSALHGGILSGCAKGDPHAEYVFTQVTNKMAEYCNSELGREPYLPNLEELCIAQCPPYPQWFRAVVLDQPQGAGSPSVRVCYLDYGNIETVPVTLLRKMLPEFMRGVPVVGLHLEIKDFPQEPTPEMLSRAVQHLKINEEGRGVLRVEKWEKLEDGMYCIHAPALLRDMEG